ncbi:isocitrate dehydrogenase (NAD(+)) idh1 [Boothiomyces sp. JEL0866]|nr:isocitrate dehydrogenase (NAD(+)) idh1 [Boothiomyces sp. JEL0866]
MSIAQTITGLIRGAARKPLTSKQGNKNFYKGKRSGRMGHWTRKGRYVVEETQKRTFVIPELVDFKLTPFVSPKANESFRNKHLLTASGTVYGGKHTVTLIPGDGVGLEMAIAVKTIFRAADVPIEWEQFDLTGYTESKDDTLLRQAMDSIRKNKVGISNVGCVKGLGHVSWNGMVRKELDVYASTTLIKNLPGKWPVRHNNVDFAIIRENTEGEYSGKEHSPVPGVVESLKVSTQQKTERIAKYAFDFALKNGRKKVTIIHKANIMKLGDGLFLRTCREVGKRYESFGIKTDDMIVDNASMQLVSKPSQFDVIVCGNLYGNILSNVGAALVGGPGLIPGANIGRDFAVFEPGCRHVGKDIMGTNKANPTSMLLSSIHLLRHIGLNDHANRISDALLQVIKEGTVLTPDVGGHNSTTDFTLAVIGKL